MTAYRPNILGVDLSFAGTGLAFPDGTTDTLRPTSKGDDRLNEVADDLVLACYRVDLVVMEDVLAKSFVAFKLGMLHGAVRAKLLANGIPYVVVSPATVKKYATGKGNARKPDMRMAWYKRVGIDCDDEDQVDASWIRAAALDAYGHPLCAMPQANRDALRVVEWPGLPRAEEPQS